MADYREVIHERLYVKTPGSDKLRRTAEGRLKRLLADGWHELERWQRADHIEVKLQRTGVAPLRARRPRPAPEERFDRRRGGGFGRGGGGRGGGRGGRPGGNRGGGRGAPRQVAPSQQAAQQAAAPAAPPAAPEAPPAAPAPEPGTPAS